MKQSIIFKITLMSLLVILIPICASVALADLSSADIATSTGTTTYSSDSSLPAPGNQCTTKGQQGKQFVDFMNNGIMKFLQAIASLLLGIATVITTIDSIINTLASVIGMTSFDSYCCVAGTFSAGSMCVTMGGYYKWWNTNVMGNPITRFIVSVATCECCKGNAGQKGIDASKGSNTPTDYTKFGGGIGSLCPLGDVANKLGTVLNNNNIYWSTGTDSKASNGNILPNKQIYGSGGIGQFQLNAFDNIYVAVGCLCPIAILNNLYKLQKIYQVHTCCVQNACTNGQSTEGCDQQLSEDLCMYWEGGILKVLVRIIASIIVGYLMGIFFEALKRLGGILVLLTCVMLVLDVIHLPEKIQAITGAFQWLQDTTNPPNCLKMKINDIRTQLKTGAPPYMGYDYSQDGRFTSISSSNPPAYSSTANTQSSAPSATTSSKRPSTDPSTVNPAAKTPSTPP